jgi:hypothetical protein
MIRRLFEPGDDGPLERGMQVATIPMGVLVPDDFGELCRAALVVCVDTFTRCILCSEVVLTPIDDD